MAEYNPSKIIKDGNTYNFRDTTKIPLSGSNAISGSLIPATDNSIDIGSSTKNIKALYTKGITLDGKTIDTDADGNLVYDGNIVDTIEEQGDGYIRYSNGIQICWGSVDFGPIEAGGGSVFDWIFPKSFVNSSYIAVCGNSSTGGQWMYQIFITFDKTTTSVRIAVANISGSTSADSMASLIVIGKWK